MKFHELFEENTLDEIVQILNMLTANDFQKDAFRLEQQVKYGDKFVRQVAQQFPELMYEGPMYRAVIVEGLEPLTLKEIKQHARAVGIQSFAKSEEGMQEWLGYGGDVEFNQADTYLQQQGIGIDIERLVLYIKQNNLEDQYSSAMFNLTRAAEVAEEVVAVYNNSLTVIGNEVWDIEHGDHVDDDDRIF